MKLLDLMRAWLALGWLVLRELLFSAKEVVLTVLRPSRARRSGIVTVPLDVPRLCNVGPVPIGAGWHAQQMRERRIRLARQAAADVIEQFEEMARRSGVRWVVRLEEGRPAKILSRLSQSACTLAVAPVGWFDQGVLDLEVNLERRLRWSGLRKGIVVLGAQADNVAG